MRLKNVAVYDLHGTGAVLGNIAGYNIRYLEHPGIYSRRGAPAVEGNRGIATGLEGAPGFSRIADGCGGVVDCSVPSCNHRDNACQRACRCGYCTRCHAGEHGGCGALGGYGDLLCA